MTNAPISRDVALRIALASRALPDTDPKRLMAVLADAVGLPPTPKKLLTLKVKDLKQAADGDLSDVETDALKKALAFLKGEAGNEDEPLPEVEAYADGELPGSIRVACASNSVEKLDGHFGSCKRFLIYQVSAGVCRLIDIRRALDSEAPDTGDGPPDKNLYRAGLIADCQVLYVLSVGGPAAAKVVRVGVHPIKKPDGGDARAAVLELQPILGSAPPWLAKVMGQTPEQRVRFEVEAEA